MIKEFLIEVATTKDPERHLYLHKILSGKNTLEHEIFVMAASGRRNMHYYFSNWYTKEDVEYIAGLVKTSLDIEISMVNTNNHINDYYLKVSW